MSGKDIPCEPQTGKLIIIKHKKDYLGSSIYKQNKLLNFIPKERRMKSLNIL